ncbi:MAG: transcriptional regulator, LysR family [Amycolatopsis sp.]|jgi:LysR family carnitine catabolism transcriptional activator|uniref:LysR family transcriptional regulator n=1 Tax=Amycolatopsis sp. TaxID=37632 RepID=UPI002614CCB8|nr:LysR family transcriptional regulator [Amycolatopsis sp.]MCU1685858.1 transcriptional regulator, LysR family [Amycolatopsis sp.]
MDLTLHQLTVFCRVARTGSFTQAAGELLLSQSVVSRSIGEIERKLDVSLLSRTTRSVDLTDAGTELLDIAEGILDSYQSGLRRFADYRAGERGHVTIAALPSIAAAVLPPVVAGFLADFPQVRVHLVDGTTREVLEKLRSGTADIAVTESSPASTGLLLRPLFEDRVVAVLPEGHHLAARAKLTWTELAAEPFVALSADSSVRRLTDLAFAQAGSEPETLVETRTIATAGGMVAAGLGVSAMPELVLPLLSFTRFVTRPLVGPVVTRKVAMHLRHEYPLSAAAHRFVDRLAQAMPVVS